ncbi:MAG: GSCFA domain-containing protein [Chitinophagaceae bacterium]
MQFQIRLHIPQLEPSIRYEDNILLMGSCFTEHIGKFLEEDKFSVLQNPYGIVFDPETLSRSVVDLMEQNEIAESELFQQDGVWHHWKFHSGYSGLDRKEVLDGMNRSIRQGHDFLKKAKWLLLTLGTSYVYRLAGNNHVVANCHKVPAKNFVRRLNTIEANIQAFDIMLYRLFRFNPDIRVVFTVSPVRHIKDGIVENNRSKARLLETVHHLVDKFDRLHYFPAYEIMVDVLRDYRFYDIDLVHPNYAGTSYVLERFKESCMNAETIELSETLHKIFLAKKHKPFNSESEQHKAFLRKYHALCLELSEQYPYLDFREELKYFGNV